MCNRNLSGWFLTSLGIFKEHFCGEKQVAKNVTWWETLDVLKIFKIQIWPTSGFS